MNSLSGAFIGSIVGAVVGCLAWIGVGYATRYELGILAVGVGIAVGIGAAMGAKGRAGTSGGILAALVAIAAIVVARYALLQMAINQQIAEVRTEFGSEIPGAEDDEYWTAFIADRIVRERESAGETIDWPYIDEDQEDNVAASYPLDIWMEAQRKWKDIPASQQPEFCAAAARSILSGDEEAFRTVASIIGVLLMNLHPMALIIMGIAAAGAFKVARNSRPVDEAESEGEAGYVQSVATTGSSALTGVPAAPTTPGQAPGSTRVPAKAAIDESQLPPQFRTKPAPPAFNRHAA